MLYSAKPITLTLITTEAYEGAIQDYKTAAKHDPNLSFAYNNLGSVYRIKKDFVSADRWYTEALKKKKDYHIAYNNRGTARFEAGNYDDALLDFRRALELKPDYAFAYNNQASVYIIQEKWKEAVSACDKALQLEPEYMEAFFNRGIAKEMLHDLDGACSDWEDAFALGSDNADRYVNGPICGGSGR